MMMMMMMMRISSGSKVCTARLPLRWGTRLSNLATKSAQPDCPGDGVHVSPICQQSLHSQAVFAMGYMALRSGNEVCTAKPSSLLWDTWLIRPGL
jgi:hypothetical protein